MNEEDKRVFGEMFESLPPDEKKAFEHAVKESGLSREQFIERLWDEVSDAEGSLDPDEEAFVDWILAGDCPDCGSSRTRPGDEIEEIDDATVARCERCGFLWCMECGMPVEAGAECGHWRICDECPEEKDEFRECGIPPEDCPYIVEWQAEIVARAHSSTCAWCGGDIPEGAEVFGTGARIREGIDLCHGSGAREGFLMEVTISGKRVPTIVTGLDSEAKKQGNDLMFMTCSLPCAEELKSALERERDVIEKAQLN